MPITVQVQQVGGRKRLLEVEEAVTVGDLKELIARDTGLPYERLKLVLRGQTLQDNSAPANLEQGAVVLAFVAPKPPPAELARLVANHHAPEPDDIDDDPTVFRLPANAPVWQRQLARLLQQRLKLPSMVLVLLFAIPRSVWLGLLAWLAGAKLATKYEVWPVFLLLSLIAVIYLNLGKRKVGEASAYSVFNDDFRELPGQLNAAQLDDQFRRGQI